MLIIFHTPIPCRLCPLSINITIFTCLATSLPCQLAMPSFADGYFSITSLSRLRRAGPEVSAGRAVLATLGATSRLLRFETPRRARRARAERRSAHVTPAGLSEEASTPHLAYIHAGKSWPRCFMI